MIFHPTRFQDAYLIESEKLFDERGFFARSFCKKEFLSKGLNGELFQCNISFNYKKGTLRGMHFQESSAAEAKCVRCLRGSIYDVIVDIRRKSPTFKQWQSFILSENNRLLLYIPEGFAHGFQSLEDNTEIFYQMSIDYQPQFARGIRWNDPIFQIKWPIPDPILSLKDKNYPDYII